MNSLKKIAIGLGLGLCCWAAVAWAQSEIPRGVGGAGSSATPASLGLNTAVGTTVYYVDAVSGSDTNNCTGTVTAACKTIQGAVNKVKGGNYVDIKGNIQISVDAGSYACAAVTGLNFDNTANGNDGGTFTIAGTTKTSDNLAAGTATGTATGGTAGTGNTTTWGTMIDAAQVWTTNDLRGRFLVLAGTGAGTYMIDSNTGTTITVAGTIAAAPTGATTYTIQDNASVITTACTAPGTAAGASIANFAGLWFGDIAGAFGQATSAPILVSNMRFNSTAAVTQLQFTGPMHASIRNNQFVVPSGAFGVKLIRGAFADLRLSSSSQVSGNGTLLFMDYPNNTNFVSAASVSSMVSAVTNNATGILGGFGSVTIATSGIHVAAGRALSPFMWFDANIIGDKLDCGGGGSTSGIMPSAIMNTSQGITGSIFLTHSDISNCTTAINLDGPFKVVTSLATGGTNTNAYLVTHGGTVQISSDSTLTGTNEITLDGNVYTLANYRLTLPTPALTSDYYSPNSGVYQ